VRIEYRVWTSEQYAELIDELLPILEPDPTKGKRDAIAIGHAVATARKLTSITIDGIAGPKRAEPGIFALYIDATEQRPPEAKNAKGTAKGGGGSGKPATPCDGLRADYIRNRQDAAYLRQSAQQKLREFNPGGYLDDLQKADVLDLLAQAIAAQMAGLNCPNSTPTGSGSPASGDGILGP
jgi:hypothetical protein